MHGRGTVAFSSGHVSSIPLPILGQWRDNASISRAARPVSLRFQVANSSLQVSPDPDPATFNNAKEGALDEYGSWIRQNESQDDYF